MLRPTRRTCSTLTVSVLSWLVFRTSWYCEKLMEFIWLSGIRLSCLRPVMGTVAQAAISVTSARVDAATAMRRRIMSGPPDRRRAGAAKDDDGAAPVC
jgi:hypothetical protein